MILRVETESGTCHEVDLEALTYRRLQLPLSPSGRTARGELRRDGELLRLLQLPAEPRLGESWILLLAPLNPAFGVTIRETTPVVAIELIEAQHPRLV